MKKALAFVLAAALTVGLAACSNTEQNPDSAASGAPTSGAPASSGQDTPSGPVANKDKPLVWFNRQPSNSTTGELDMAALSFNEDTYYVGFDANQGAELQGTMVKQYIEENIDTIDRNGDGVIGYVLAIGDIGHNDSIARTRGVRTALSTAVQGDSGVNSDPVGTNADGSATAVQDGTLEINGTTYTVRELASQEMKNSAGATWDAATAGNAITTPSPPGPPPWAIRSTSWSPTTTAWAWPCSTPGPRPTACPPSATTPTPTRWPPSPRATAGPSASTPTCRPT